MIQKLDQVKLLYEYRNLQNQHLSEEKYLKEKDNIYKRKNEIIHELKQLKRK